MSYCSCYDLLVSIRCRNRNRTRHQLGKQHISGLGKQCDFLRVSDDLMVERANDLLVRREYRCGRNDNGNGTEGLSVDFGECGTTGDGGNIVKISTAPE